MKLNVIEVIYLFVFFGFPLCSCSSIGKMILFSDIHLNISWNEPVDAILGYDSSVALLESALKFAQQTLPEPDLFLYTGDHVAHGRFNQSFVDDSVARNVETIHRYFTLQNATKVQNSSLQPHFVTAVIGNADVTPDYHLEVTDPTMEMNPQIQSISSPWKNELNEEQFQHLQRSGNFLWKVEQGLFLVVLNTVSYSTSHTPSTDQLEDPFHQFAWLEKTLDLVRENEAKAYIVGHIPPVLGSYDGSPQWHPKYIKKYQGILGRFTDIIFGQLFGHIHSLEWRLPLDSSFKNTLKAPVIMSGSISPLFGNNPSFGVLDYDKVTKEIVDLTIYGTDLSEKNKNTTFKGEALVWKKLFSFKSEYQIESVSVKELSKVYERMKMDSSLVHRYYWNSKAHSSYLPLCNSRQCEKKVMCMQKWWSIRREFKVCVGQDKKFGYSWILLLLGLPLVGYLIWRGRKWIENRKQNSGKYEVLNVEKGDSKEMIQPSIE